MAADGAGGSGAAVRQLTNLGAGSVAAGLGGGMLYGIPTSYRTPQRAALFGAKLFAGGYAGQCHSKARRCDIDACFRDRVAMNTS